MGSKTPNEGDQDEAEQIAEILGFGESSNLNRNGQSKVTQSGLMDPRKARLLTSTAETRLLSALYQDLDGLARKYATKVAQAAQESLDEESRLRREEGVENPNVRPEYTPRDAYEDILKDIQGLGLAMDAARDTIRDSDSEVLHTNEDTLEAIIERLEEDEPEGKFGRMDRNKKSVLEKLREAQEKDMDVEIHVKEA